MTKTREEGLPSSPERGAGDGAPSNRAQKWAGSEPATSPNKTMRAPLRYDSKFGAIYDAGGKEIACPIGNEGAALVHAFNTWDKTENLVDTLKDARETLKQIKPATPRDRALIYTAVRQINQVLDPIETAQKWLEKVGA